MLSIEHIRDMQRDASLNPFEGQRLIFIIDRADTLMFPDGLATPAANALLKTLEEPAPTVILALIASDRRAVPETVASRCQSIELRPVPADVITAGLAAHRGTPEDEATRVARICEGRPGRAIELLDDPAALSRYQQTVMRVLEASTSTLEGRFRYARDLSAVYRRDRESVEAELKIWAGVWRDILLASNGLGDQILHEDWRETIDAIAAATANMQIVDALHGLENAANALARNAVAQLALEVMMLDLPSIAPGITVASSATVAPDEEGPDDEVGS
jgi:DNA polymerase-3 subunit delta'